MKAQYLAAGTPILLNCGAMHPTRDAVVLHHEPTSFGVNTWVEVAPLVDNFGGATLEDGYRTTIEGEETELGVGWRVAG